MKNVAGPSLGDRLFERLSTPLVTLDAQGLIERANPAFGDLLGWTPEELQGVAWDTLIIATRQDQHSLKFTDLIQSEDACARGHGRLQQKSGRNSHVNVRLSCLERDGPHPLYLVEVTEPDLPDSPSVFHGVNACSLDAVARAIPVEAAVFDTEMRYLLATEQWCAVYGLELGNLIGRSHYELFPEIGEDMKAAHRRCLQGSREQADAAKFIRLDGTVTYMNWAVSPWFTQCGEIGGIIICSENVTERHLIAQALKESRERLLEAQAIARLGSWEFQLKSGRCFWSDEEFRLYGFEPGEVEAGYASAMLRVHPLDRANFESQMLVWLKAGEPFEFEHRVLHPDGRVSYLHHVAKPVCAVDGTVVAMRGTTTDLTDRKCLEERVREQYERLLEFQKESELNRLRDQFVNSVTHELRTPLSSIMGFAEFLEDELGGPLSAESQGFVASIQQGARRLEHLVNDLLDFARIEAGTFTLRYADFDLCQEIARNVENMRPLAEQAELRILLDREASPLSIRADAQRVGQVLCNLLSNAIKFAPAGSAISIRVKSESDGARIEIIDRGCGIEAEDIPRLFRRFIQLESGVRLGKGTGLGLFVCRALVEAHGGEIGVYSNPGVETTFWFTLPKVPQPTHVEVITR